MAKATDLPQGVVVRGALRPGYDKVLTAEAVAFVAELERKFGAERRRLLGLRADTLQGGLIALGSEIRELPD